MATSLSKDSKIVLKLDLGEHGLRRIPFHKLWDEPKKTVSFNRLVELIISFKALPPKCVENERRIITATYTDEDGDEITISSDSELLDAFEQYLGSQPPILRAKAVVVKAPVKNVVKEQRKIIKEIKKEVKMEQRALKKQCSSEVKRVHAPTPKVHLPTVAPPKVIPKLVNPAKAVKATPPPTPAPKPATPSRCNTDFIHGRHTCDGCLTTPIFGTRYHAVNMPDYDLCSKCYPNCTDEHIIFKPVELDRDKHLQARWQRRFRKLCRPNVDVAVHSQDERNETRPNPNYIRLPEVASGTQTKRVINEMDDALKEAIRRSLIDAARNDKARMKKNKMKAMKKEAAEKKKAKEEKTKVEEDKTKVEEENGVKNVEKDIHVPPLVEKDVPVAVPVPVEEQVVRVPQIVDVAAGNEATQKTLDDMDPKVKEALRKKLNAFFALRSKGKSSTSSDENKYDSALAPTEETQEKLDAMNPDTKEALRRGLNEFFENRRASTEEDKEDSVNVEPDDNVKRTKEIVESMDEQTKEYFKRSVSEFIARRHEGNTSEGEGTEDNQIPSVVIDIEVDGDLSIGTDDVDFDVEGITEGSRADANNDEETADESDSGISEGTASKDESWQVVSEDEMIAVAAQMLGSALFESDSGSNHDSNHDDME